MCDPTETAPGTGWRGWSTNDTSRPAKAAGDWIDLLDGTIEPEDFERRRPQLEPGDILLLDTGVAQYVGTPDYERHAALSVAAAEWLVDKKIKLLAMDTPTPDVPIHRRPRGLDWPVHHTLLRDGVLISENVANARSLVGLRVELLFLPLNIVGADGAPARVLGRAICD